MKKETIKKIHNDLTVFNKTALASIVPNLLSEELKERWWVRVSNIADEKEPILSLEKAFDDYPDKLVRLLKENCTFNDIRVSDLFDAQNDTVLFRSAVVRNPGPIISYLNTTLDSVPSSRDWVALEEADEVGVYVEEGYIFLTPAAVTSQGALKASDGDKAYDPDRSRLTSKWVEDINKYHEYIQATNVAWATTTCTSVVTSTLYFLIGTYIDAIKSEMA